MIESFALQTTHLVGEALSIVEELRLLEILRLHGRAEVVGSVALDLVVKPDIDVHLHADSEDLLAVCDDIYHQLLASDRVRQVRISDYRDSGGLKVGIDSLPGLSGPWSIDIWVTNSAEAAGFQLVDALRPVLTAETRQTILAIKRHYHESGRLRDALSTRVYSAVVDHGVRTPEEFEKLLRRSEDEGMAEPACVGSPKQ